MTPVWPCFIHIGIAAFLILTVLWVLQWLKKDAGFVDIGWASGVGVAAIYLAACGQGWLPRRVLVASLASIWSFRLCLYIIRDRILRGDEDGRYASLRSYWGKKANLYFFFFFTSQTLLVLLFTLPFVSVVQNSTMSWMWVDALGVLIWIFAVSMEMLSDRQLQIFRRKPENRGKTCRAGWWRYSRHPNYFFEWLHWWAYVCFAAMSPLWWLAFVGPIVMLIFLYRLTGIPYTEKQALRSRGEDYKEYQKTTSAFFPMPPRRSS